MMNQDQSNATWQHNLGDDHMLVNHGEDDFATFLDLGSEFPDFENLNHNGPSGLDTPMGRLGFAQFNMDSDIPMNADMDAAASLSMMNGQGETYAGGGLPQQAHGQKHMQAQMSDRHYQVPLTPVSGEMNGASYLQHVDGNGYVVYDRNQSFTPLVSPAQTPLDAFCMPEFATSSDFFSPLNSPAIEAQHVLGSNAHAMSPAEFRGENHNTKSAQPVAGKRSQRKPAASTRSSARSVKQSPAMKPQTRRRPPSVTSLPTDLLEALSKEPNAGRGAKPASGQSSQVIASSDSSVSPEPLSEALMPPPALPRSSGRSPRIGAEDNEPATPASIMRMPSGQTDSRIRTKSSSMRNVDDNIMEDILLPDSAIPPVRPALHTIETAGTETENGDEQRTPTLSAKSAKLSASSTPRTSAAMTPQVLSPLDDSNRLKRSESRAGVRGSKKRQGTASAAISPALRPKISPNISPLVPASGPGVPILSAETSALYLASKSNYQNILEGTHLPGVSYPEALAENLSSKRTSHKIAEQGRRNRINTALKEIEALLPPSILASNRKDRAGSNENEEGDKSAGGQSASKASTVEMAITYIRALQAEVRETKDKLDATEKKLADGHSSSSQASE